MVNVLSPLVVVAGPVSKAFVDICSKLIASQVSAIDEPNAHASPQRTPIRCVTMRQSSKSLA